MRDAAALEIKFTIHISPPESHPIPHGVDARMHLMSHFLRHNSRSSGRAIETIISFTKEKTTAAPKLLACKFTITREGVAEKNIPVSGAFRIVPERLIAPDPYLHLSVIGL
jgi:hypothetical protein